MCVLDRVGVGRGWLGSVGSAVKAPLRPCPRLRSSMCREALEPKRVWPLQRTDRKLSTWHVKIQINIKYYYLHSYIMLQRLFIWGRGRQQFYLFKFIVHPHLHIYIIKAKYTARLMGRKILKPHGRREKGMNPEIKAGRFLECAFSGPGLRVGPRCLWGWETDLLC